MQTQNLSASQFADEVGVQRSSMSHILSGRNNPSLDFVMKILNRFPEIRADWILFGKGSMYESEQKSLTEKEVPVVKELDLFSDQLFDEQPSVHLEAKNDINELAIPLQKELSAPQKLEEEKSVQHHPIENSVNKQVEKEDERYSNVVKEKTIKRMVIFYSDNTFDELKVEKE